MIRHRTPPPPRSPSRAAVVAVHRAVVALAGCAPSGARRRRRRRLGAHRDRRAAPSGDIDSFTWATYAEPYSLDYAYAFDYADNQVLANVCESLLRLNPDYTLSAGSRRVVRAPDPDDVGLHDPRRRDLPRRHAAHGRRRRRLDEPPPRPRGRLVLVLGVPERHLDRADRRPRGHGRPRRARTRSSTSRWAARPASSSRPPRSPRRAPTTATPPAA